MSRIRILDSSTINQIAAGEVIERPGSVVKELLENALDAEARSVRITVRDGGKTFIQIQDDGIGMSREDLSLCVQRHTTSKLTGHNLLDIHSFGFRGEALASICEISRVSIQTYDGSLKPAPTGWQLDINGGVADTVSPTSLPRGTSITIRDLFYTTPARLKFLKATQTELSYCLQHVKQLALSSPQTGFTFTHNDKVLLQCEPAPKEADADEALARRVRALLGEEAAENGAWMSEEKDGVRCVCWAALPTYRMAAQQYCFVNNRPVRDRLLIAAVRAGYQDVLMAGEQPAFVLFLTLNPQLVDVNVHPTKAEVRFRDWGKVRALVLSVIRATINQSAQRTSSTLEGNFLRAVEMMDQAPSAYPAKAIGAAAMPIPTPSRYWQHPIAENREAVRVGNAAAFWPKPTLVSEAAQTAVDLGAPVGQIFDSFILAQQGDSLFVVDQHAAHERIVYEELQKLFVLDGNGWVVYSGPRQKLLSPESVPLNQEEALAAQELAPYLERMGFEVRWALPEIWLEAVPACCAETNPTGLLCELLREMLHDGVNSVLLQKLHHLFATYACHHSVRANHALSLPEMDSLLRQIESTARSGQCNHGRPSYVRVSRAALNHLFERA